MKKIRKKAIKREKEEIMKKIRKKWWREKEKKLWGK